MMLGIVGVVVWFVLGLIGISNSVDDFERVPADGGGTIAMAFGPGGIGCLAGAILLIVTIVRRSGEKKRRTAESPPNAAHSGDPGAPPAMLAPPPGAPPPR